MSRTPASFFRALVSFSLIFIVAPAWSESAPDPSKLHLASVSALVVDLDKKAPLYEKNADWPVPIASITKLMTAMVVLDAGQPLNEMLTITREDFDHLKHTFSRLHNGARLKRGEMLKLSLMSSENRTAASLSRHYEGGVEAFVAAMNRRAAQLGMNNTVFVDATGLSSDNQSTARDLVKMLVAAQSYDLIREYTTAPNHTVRVRAPNNVLGYYNTNPLVHRDAWAIDLSKTGYIDEAGRCLVMLARINERPVAMVLLDSFGKRSPQGDAGRVRNWIETGTSGPVASGARRYEQQRISELSERVAMSGDS
jgi:D-alanyl-D-alanine endopeptidase (penicillin-binding protein 7)